MYILELSVYIRICIHNMHTYIRTCICTYIRTCIRTYCTYVLEMQVNILYNDISPYYCGTLGNDMSLSIHNYVVLVYPILIYRSPSKCIFIHASYVVVVHCLQILQLNLQLFRLYCTIYRCIIIHK